MAAAAGFASDGGTMAGDSGHTGACRLIAAESISQEDASLASLTVDDARVTAAR